MKITELLTDETILAEFGQRIAQRRLDLQLTQADVAEQAGVGKRTLERIEAGASAQMSNIVRILRALGGLSDLERVLPESGPSPMEMLQSKGKVRQRATKRRSAVRANKPWSWDDNT